MCLGSSKGSVSASHKEAIREDSHLGKKKKKIHTWYQTKTINETNVEAIPRL